ncbi:MAG: DMT family transporter [Candidatus Bathyarchaeia archaeon]
MTALLGELFSIMAAFLWAGSTIVAAKTLRKVSPLTANAVRTLSASISMFLGSLVMGAFTDLFSLDLYGSLMVIGAALIGFGLGDTCLYWSINLVGVSRSYTIGYSYPFFVMALATLLLGESLLLQHLVGSALVFAGIAIVFAERDVKMEQVNRRKGLMIAFAAAVLWSIGTTLVAAGLRTVSIIQANTVRFPLLSLVLITASRLQSKNSNLDRRALILLILSGILGMTLAGIVFLFSIQLIGASRAAPLSSSSPVWAAVMSSIFLKEKISPRVITSTLIVVAGTYLLM